MADPEVNLSAGRAAQLLRALQRVMSGSDREHCFLLRELRERRVLDDDLSKPADPAVSDTAKRIR